MPVISDLSPNAAMDEFGSTAVHVCVDCSAI